jgi:hypothetical protein
MAETEAGMVTGAVAVSLLMLGAPAELARLAREGWFKPAGPDRWRLVDLVQGYIRHLQAAAKVATTKQLASAFSITGTRVLQLSDEGWFKPLGKNRWDRDEATRGYFNFLRADDRRASKSAGEFRLRDAKARVVEMQLAERARDLIPYDEAETALETVVGMVRTEMGGVAARVTRDLVVRRAIEKAVNEALARIVDQLSKQIATLRQSDGAPGAVADLDS